MQITTRGVGLFGIQTTRSEFSTRRTRVESNPLLNCIELLELNLSIEFDRLRTVRHDQTV